MPQEIDGNNFTIDKLEAVKLSSNTFRKCGVCFGRARWSRYFTIKDSDRKAGPFYRCEEHKDTWQTKDDPPEYAPLLIEAQKRSDRLNGIGYTEGEVKLLLVENYSMRRRLKHLEPLLEKTLEELALIKDRQEKIDILAQELENITKRMRTLP